MQADNRIKLVTPGDLEKMYEGNPPDLVVLDCSSGAQFKQTFDAGRVPKAKWLDLDSFRDTQNPLPMMMPPKQVIVERCQKLNINRACRIVCYDQ
jgi:3-mercaptopyruvate sulfurtransferase SseA